MYNGEIVLADDYLVRYGDWVVLDGHPTKCNTYGSVSFIKKYYSKQFRKNIRNICWCNVSLRNL